MRWKHRSILSFLPGACRGRWSIYIVRLGDFRYVSFDSVDTSSSVFALIGLLDIRNEQPINGHRDPPARIGGRKISYRLELSDSLFSATPTPFIFHSLYSEVVEPAHCYLHIGTCGKQLLRAMNKYNRPVYLIPSNILLPSTFFYLLLFIRLTPVILYKRFFFFKFSLQRGRSEDASFSYVESGEEGLPSSFPRWAARKLFSFLEHLKLWWLVDYFDYLFMCFPAVGILFLYTFVFSFLATKHRQFRVDLFSPTRVRKGRLWNRVTNTRLEKTIT